jgi:hypothetical protein
MTPTIGRIVHYYLSDQDAAQINKRRADASAHLAEHRENGNVVHMGNTVQGGDVYPLAITRTWGGAAVNGQVLLDGSDTLWVTSVTEGDGQRNWFWPPRV